MRLKSMPRKRKTNYFYEPVNASREDGRPTDITQDVTEEFMNIEEYCIMSKKPDAKKCGIAGSSGDFDPRQFMAGKYVEEFGIFRNIENSTKQIFEAVNLSTKNSPRADLKSEAIGAESFASDVTSSSNKFAGSLLYQIMTDPTFVENIKNNKEMKKLTCKFCKKKFSNYDELQYHLDSRLNNLDRITCCACGKTFGQKRYLRYHQRCHVVNNKFTCEFCMKKYSRMDNLSRHRTCHTNPDKYSCNICKKTFSRRDLMTKHVKSHDGKKVNCTHCKEVFNNFMEMKAHRLVSHIENTKN